MNSEKKIVIFNAEGSLGIKKGHVFEIAAIAWHTRDVHGRAELYIGSFLEEFLAHCLAPFACKIDIEITTDIGIYILYMYMYLYIQYIYTYTC